MAASPDFSEGIALARQVLSQLEPRSAKWKSRNVPVFIRERLWRPYYITEAPNGEPELYIIRLPDEQHDKVHFDRWEPPSA